MQAGGQGGRGAVMIRYFSDRHQSYMHFITHLLFSLLLLFVECVGGGGARNQTNPSSLPLSFPPQEQLCPRPAVGDGRHHHQPVCGLLRVWLGADPHHGLPYARHAAVCALLGGPPLNAAPGPGVLRPVRKGGGRGAGFMWGVWGGF